MRGVAMTSDDPRLADPASNVNDAIQDRIIRHMVFLERLKGGEVRDVLRILNDEILPNITSRIRDRLEAVSQRGSSLSVATTRRLESLENLVKRLASDASTTLSRHLRPRVRELGSDEVDWLVRTIREELKVDLNFELPAARTIFSAVTSTPFAGNNLEQWFGTLEDSLSNRISQAIRQGIVEGDTVGQIVRRIRGSSSLNFTDGIYEGTRRGAEAIVRSTINHTSNQARLELFKENSDVLSGLKYTATLDSRTSLICIGLDGNVYPLDEGPRPPVHVNCRSTMTPIIKSARQLGLRDIPETTRASINGQVPGSTTYGEWLRRQPDAVQDEVLGPTRARLFRDGGLEVSRFTNANLKTLTLEELRVIEKSSFQDAGIEV